MRGLPSAKVVIVSILLGQSAYLCSGQSPAPPPGAGAAKEQECSKKRAEALSLAPAGSSSRAVTLLTDLYSKCPSYENARDLADAEVEAGRYESAKALVTSLLDQQNRADVSISHRRV